MLQVYESDRLKRRLAVLHQLSQDLLELLGGNLARLHVKVLDLTSKRAFYQCEQGCETAL